MENRYYEILAGEKRAIVEQIKAYLQSRPGILFAYLYGSFFSGDRFRDIDIAVYLKPPFPSPLQVELDMEAELGRRVKTYPVEIRVLNHAPLSFRYNVIKHGEPIFIVDDDLRCDFAEATLSHYFDFAPFRAMYLKEVLGSGI
jgi:predicted nucleotidyltransferase